MDLEKYGRAKMYAQKVYTFGDPLDLVHNSYLIWHHRRGTDLFDQDLPLIIQVMKNVLLNEYTHLRTYKWRGEVFKRDFVSADKRYEDGDLVYDVPDSNSTDSLAIYNDLNDKLRKVIVSKDITPQKNMVRAYDSLIKGSMNKEVQEELGIGRTNTHYAIAAIREELEPLIKRYG